MRSWVIFFFLCICVSTLRFLLWACINSFFLFFFFLLYSIVLVLPYLPYINMNPPRVYMCSPSWTPLPPSSLYHPSGSSQCTSPKLPVSCIEPGLAIRLLYDFWLFLLSLPLLNDFILLSSSIKWVVVRFNWNYACKMLRMVPGTRNAFTLCLPFSTGFPGGSDTKASARNAGEPGSIPGLGRSRGEGNGNPRQYSCLENSMDWEAPQSLVGYSLWGRKESDTTERLHFTLLLHSRESFEVLEEDIPICHPPSPQAEQRTREADGKIPCSA